MQSHIRQVERLTNLFSPVGIHVSHYGSGHSHHKRRKLSTVNGTPVNVNVQTEHNHNNENNSHKHNHQESASHHNHSVSSVSSHNNNHHRRRTNKSSSDNSLDDRSWNRESLSMRHERNRKMYHKLGIKNVDMILNRLVSYGFETSADIAKLQPWQLRILKKEIPCIDGIYLQAFQMWGQQEYYDEHQNKTFRQFLDPAIWLEYNEIDLIVKSFDSQKRGYRCFICGASHEIKELDVLRWHLWTHHRNSFQLKASMQETKRHWIAPSFQAVNGLMPQIEATSPTTSHSSMKSSSNVISLLEDSSSDDDIDLSRKTKEKQHQTRSRTKKLQQRKSQSKSNKSKSSDSQVHTSSNYYNHNLKQHDFLQMEMMQSHSHSHLQSNQLEQISRPDLTNASPISTSAQSASSSSSSLLSNSTMNTNMSDELNMNLQMPMNDNCIQEPASVSDVIFEPIITNSEGNSVSPVMTSSNSMTMPNMPDMPTLSNMYGLQTIDENNSYDIYAPPLDGDLFGYDQGYTPSMSTMQSAAITDPNANTIPNSNTQPNNNNKNLNNYDIGSLTKSKSDDNMSLSSLMPSISLPSLSDPMNSDNDNENGWFQNGGDNFGMNMGTNDNANPEFCAALLSDPDFNYDDTNSWVGVGIKRSAHQI